MRRGVRAAVKLKSEAARPDARTSDPCSGFLLGCIMRCAICGGTDPAKVRDWVTQGGTRYGMACRGEHAGLLWEAHFLRLTGGTKDEIELVLWKWRRARTEAEGRRFDEPAPMSDAERGAAAQQAYWQDVLKEVA